MGFGKAFGIGLILFMALTFVFALLIQALAGQIGNFFSDLVNPINNLFLALVGSILSFPSLILSMLMLGIDTGALDLEITLMLLAPMIVMIISAVIAGKLAEGKGAAFGAWFLICIIASVLLLVFAIIDGLSVDLGNIMLYMIPAIVNGIFYGAFALLASGSEYY